MSTENKNNNNEAEMRDKGLNALSLVLKQEKNRICYEKYIYNQVKKQVDMVDMVDTPGIENIYTWCIYQVIGILLKEGTKKVRTLIEEIKEGKIGWKSSTYTNISLKIDEFDDYLDKPFEVVEGVVECGKCHSKKTWSVQKQTRSSDEPMTTFSTCVMCGHKWTYSG